MRIQPVGPPSAYQTYRQSAPLRTHWRSATCAEYECQAHLNGWLSIVPSVGDLADYIRADRARRWTEERGPDGMSTFRFEPGQTCYEQSRHAVPLERPPLNLVLLGDWRVNKPLRSHQRPELWVEDFQEHTDTVVRQLGIGG